MTIFVIPAGHIQLVKFDQAGLMTTKHTECDNPDTNFALCWLGTTIGDDTWHFHRRLYERYAVVLGPGEYTRITRDIRRKRAPRLKERSDGASIYLFWIPPLTTPVFIVARPRGKLFTALPDNDRLLALVPWSRVMPQVNILRNLRVQKDV